MKSVQQMLTQLEGLLGTSDISEWEQGFIESVVNRASPLSGKQLEIVERIYKKHFA